MKMPQPDFGLYSGYTHRDDVVREMRDKYEARIRELESLPDQRAALELIRVLDAGELPKGNSLVESAVKRRILELTEWRPMKDAPRDGRSVLARILGGEDVIGWTGMAWTDGRDTFTDGHYLGWLPIPPRGPRE